MRTVILLRYKELPGMVGCYRRVFSKLPLVSALGIVVTMLMLPETKGKTLEELNEEAQTGGGCDSPAEKIFLAFREASRIPVNAEPPLSPAPSPHRLVRPPASCLGCVARRRKS
jgi:hypothetical protein